MNVIEITTTAQNTVEVTTTANVMTAEVISDLVVYEVEVKGLFPNVAPGTVITVSIDNVYGEILTGAGPGFTTAQDFVGNSTRVFKNGGRMRIGEDYDYTELGANQIVFNYPVRVLDTIQIDYVKYVFGENSSLPYTIPFVLA